MVCCWAGWYIEGITAGEKDPLESPLGSVYTVVKNKYYFDELYDKIFVRPSYWFAETFTYMIIDRKIIDGFLHWLAKVTIIIGNFFRNYIDKPIVNGFGDFVGESTKRLGRTFRFIQTGKIQQYMIIALVMLGCIQRTLSITVVFEYP